MIDTDLILPLLPEAYYSRGQIRSTCPFCDKPGHFYVSKKTLLWICHKCQAKGNLYGLLKQLDALHLLEGAPVHLEQPLAPLRATLSNTTFVSTILNLPVARLPAGFKPLRWNDGTPYTKYLKERKYTQEDFLTYQPGYTELVENYEGYVLIPIYQNWLPKSFLGRSLLPDAEKKYLNQKEGKFHLLLDGFDTCTANARFGIVVEGHFDRISVKRELDLPHQNDWAVFATFGKKLSAAQAELICSANLTDLFFMYDLTDAVQQIKQYGNVLKQFLRVWGCWLDTNLDPAQLGAKALLKMLHTAQPIENYTYNILQTNALK